MTGIESARSSGVNSRPAPERDTHGAEVVRRHGVALDRGILRRVGVHVALDVKAVIISVAAEGDLRHEGRRLDPRECAHAFEEAVLECDDAGIRSRVRGAGQPERQNAVGRETERSVE